MRRLVLALFGFTVAALVVSGIGPHDRLTWWMEIAPVLMAWPVILATERRFPLTPLVLVLVTIHGVILMVGGHWTYAEVPLGFWVRDALGLARNHYDRLGHFAQGFVPALVIREVLKRSAGVRKGWLAFCSLMVALGFSAIYELIEWWAAIFTASGATAFLGTQGDPWDTQWDMFLCGVGAACALLVLSRVHDRQVERVTRAP